jgi:hypothetical protein
MEEAVGSNSKPGAQTADQRIAVLQDAIRAAFPAVAYTGAITRHDGTWLPELTEENAIPDDDKFVYEALVNRSWIDVSRKFLDDEPDGFVLLTSEALPAFLAAWLMRSLDEPGGENKVREFLVYAFSPSPSYAADNNAYTASLIKSLNPSQRFVVRSLLAEFCDSEVSGFIRASAHEAVRFLDGLQREQS